jgi:hypothetical protein
VLLSALEESMNHHLRKLFFALQDVVPCGTISPAELFKLRRCGSFNLSGPIIYQRLWFNSNKQPRASKFVFRLPHSRCDFLEPLWFPCSDLRTENIRRDCSPVPCSLGYRLFKYMIQWQGYFGVKNQGPWWINRVQPITLFSFRKKENILI